LTEVYGDELPRNRDAAEWDALRRATGFADVRAETIESEQITANGAPTRRYSIIVTGRG
jgi:hypothetical protein